MTRTFNVRSLAYRTSHVDYEGKASVPVPPIVAMPADPLPAACVAAGISMADLFKLTRAQHLAEKRFHVMWILRQRGWSYPRIAKRLGRTHHTTALYGVRRWNAILAGRMAAK